MRKIGKKVSIRSRLVRKLIVKIRMWYADIRGHHGKKWDYEPSHNYLGYKQSKKYGKD